MSDLTTPRPPQFLWGAGTSAHQIEGGNERNDWWAWEAVPGNIVDGARSGPACLSWQRWQEDLDLVRGLGLNAYRFSIEWSRVEPEMGRHDETALGRYRAMLEGCRSRGITPIVTLHHFTNPIWFAALGGWEEPKNLPHFVRHARLMGEWYADLVDHWVTVNEPEVLGFYGYDAGIFPPGIKNRSRALAVIANLLEAHGLAAHALKEVDKVDADGDGVAASTGVAKHWALLEPRLHWSPLDRLVASAQHKVFNVAVARALAGGPIEFAIPGARPVRRRVDALQGSSDFLGVNYYTQWMVSLFGEPRSCRRGAPTNDIGWEIYPEGLERALHDCSAFGLPMIVTENGVADAADRWRPEFIRESLRVLDRAKVAGLDVRGYLHWSLMDNFEWKDGHLGRFGLYETDFEHPEAPRLKRPSAGVYQQEIAVRQEIAARE
jgi:beta-glucosidase